MTAVDWIIVAFAVLMGAWGYRHGLIVGVLSLAGFVAGAFLGSRLGPALLAEGSESPYAPLTALAGALLIGGLAAISLDGLARALRRRVLGPAGRRRAVKLGDAAGGALLLAAVGLAMAWLLGAVALHAPGAKELRQEVQRSAILGALNETFPPSGEWLNSLNRIDPGVAVQGPDARVGAPRSAIAGDPEVRAAGDSVVRVLGTACGLAVSGSGWIAEPGVVVTNAHVVAGEEDTAVSFDDDEQRIDVTPIHYDSANDLAVLRVEDLQGPPLPFAQGVASGTPAAVLGYPENGPFTITPARVGETALAISEDSYGRGPVQRELTSLRGRVRKGNSGGPLVDGDGNVLTTVFAATIQGKPGGYGVPNRLVADALADSRGAAEVSTGPCVPG